MKISQVIELTQQQPIAEIAKHYLTIGGNPTCKAIQQTRCHTTIGQPIVIFDDSEDPSNLEYSIYNYLDKLKAIDKAELLQRTKIGTNEDAEFLPRKRRTYDLNVHRVKEFKLYYVKEEKTQCGAVEKTTRAYLDGQIGQV